VDYDVLSPNYNSLPDSTTLLSQLLSKLAINIVKDMDSVCDCSTTKFKCLYSSDKLSYFDTSLQINGINQNIIYRTTVKASLQFQNIQRHR